MRTKIVTIVVAVCFGVGVTQPLRAQASSKTSRSAAQRSASVVGLAPNAAERPPSGQYPQLTLEDLRTELLNIADSVQEFSVLAPPELVDADGLRAARAQIQNMSTQHLNTLRRGIDPSKLHSRLVRARAAIAEYNKAPKTPLLQKHTEVPGDTLPNANGTCTSANGTDVTRIPAAVVIAADVVFFIADGVREAAQDACKEELVVAGEGGNTSLVCIIVDAVWIAAKAVDEGIHFCDDDLTGAVGDANYGRLADVHEDVDAVDNHLATANTEIDTRIGNLDTHLSTVDTHIALEFTALDTHIAVELAALDAHITSLIATLSAQVAAEANKLIDGELQIMKLELTPEGLRKLVPAILTCDGTPTNLCPNVLTMCPGGKCSWNNVGPLP